MTKFVAIVSGKGGVGKTTSTINVAKALVNIGKSVIVVDANVVTPNIALNLGILSPKATLNHVLRREKDVNDVIHAHESGFSFIPSSTSYEEYQKTNPQHLSFLFKRLENKADFVLIDCPSGLGYDLSEILKHCDEALVVTTPTLSASIEALKSMEVAKSHDNIVAGIVLNMSHKGKHELSIREVESLLGHPVLAKLRHCKKIRKAAHKYQPVHSLYPRSKSSKQFTKIAQHIALAHPVE